jgi:DNA ligase 1
MNIYEPMLPDILDSFEQVFTNWDAVAIEPKIDGIRIQIHLKNGECKIFTRTGNEVTEKLPILCSKLIESCFSKDTVLDGELVAAEKGKILPFEETMKLIKSKKPPLNASVVLFDLIKFEKCIAYDLPYFERRQMLEIAVNSNDNVSVVPSKFVKNEKEAEELYRKILDLKFEGIVAKDVYGYYDFGRSTSVLKLKPLNFIDLIVASRQPLKAGGYKYILNEKNKEKAMLRDYRCFEVGAWVEVAFEKEYSSGKLRFARIVREREDK